MNPESNQLLEVRKKIAARHNLELFAKLSGELQQAFADLIQQLGDHHKEEEFVTAIYNQLTIGVFIEQMLESFSNLLQVFADWQKFAEGVGLTEKQLQQRESFLLLHDYVLKIISLLKETYAPVCGIFNYQENYQVYQALQNCMQNLSAVYQALTSDIEDDSATLSDAQQTQLANCVIVLSDKITAISKKYATPGKSAKTSNIEVVNSTQHDDLLNTVDNQAALSDAGHDYPILPESQQNEQANKQTILHGESRASVDIAQKPAELKVINLTQRDALLKSTAQSSLSEIDIKFLDKLPTELLLEIASYLKIEGLYALACASKALARRLLPAIKKILANDFPLQIVARETGTSFLYTHNKLYGYGSNTFAQLGLGHADPVAKVTAISIPDLAGDIRQVIVGNHTLVVTTQGLYGCGNNQYGQLGLGRTYIKEQFIPITIPGFTGEIHQVAIFRGCTIILTSAGLYGCGENSYGELDLGHTNPVTQWTPITIPGFTGEIHQIIAGPDDVFLLTSAGLYGCGENSYGELGLGHTNPVTQWTPITILDLVGEIRQIVVGSRTIVVTTQGLYGCGNNNCGQLGLGHVNPVTHWTQIPIPAFFGEIQQVISRFDNLSSTDYTIVLTTAGLLFVCGNFFDIASDGTMRNLLTKWRPIAIPYFTGEIYQIAANDNVVLALTSAGLFSCGLNNYGQAGLGNTSPEYQFKPITIPGFAGKILQVITIRNNTFLLTTQGIFGCGWNSLSELGLDHRDLVNKFTFIPLPNELSLVLEQLATLKGIVKFLEHPTVISMQENVAKTYLLPAPTQKVTAIQKQAALQELQLDIDQVSTIEALHKIFLAVKQAGKGILRQYWENRLLYGNTDSYCTAIQMLAAKALIFANSTSDELLQFAYYDFVHDILAEALRCGATGSDWKKIISHLQQSALNTFKQELNQQQDATGVMILLSSLLKEKNILRYITILFTHGYSDTNFFKQALLLLAQKVNSPEMIFTKQDLPSLYLLLEHLKELKLSSNPNWRWEFNRLQNKIEKIHQSLSSHDSKNSQQIQLTRI